MTHHESIIVGYDASDGAKLALEWAVAEAAARQAPLRVVYAYRGGYTYGSLARYGNLMEPEIDLLRVAARRLVTEGADLAAKSGHDVVVTPVAYDGDPVATLVADGPHAALIVVGSRRLGPTGSVLLGSVGGAVAARAACPVVVVRGPAGEPAEHAHVVVGVDPGKGNPEALEFAFEYASRHGAPLRAVLSWYIDPLTEIAWSPRPPAPPQAEAVLSEALAGFGERYPDVEVHRAVVRGHPVESLVAESNAERLLVVGAHGRNAVAGTLLGSVSQGVLHHATCPVAVVHPAKTS
jgi:nucleotide-binding universal stress UspA family protein